APSSAPRNIPYSIHLLLLATASGKGNHFIPLLPIEAFRDKQTINDVLTLQQDQHRYSLDAQRALRDTTLLNEEDLKHWKFIQHITRTSYKTLGEKLPCWLEEKAQHPQ